MTVNKHVPLTQQIGAGSFIKEEVMLDKRKKKKSKRKDSVKSDDDSEED